MRGVLTKERLLFGLLDPTLEEEVKTLIYAVRDHLCESVPLAIDIIAEMAAIDPKRIVEYILLLHDMNITGGKISVAYRYCNNNVRTLMVKVLIKDEKMAQYINEQFSVPHGKVLVDHRARREY